MHICKIYINHVDVIRVNQVNIKQLHKYDKIIISPGPGIPSDYPVLFDIINEYKNNKSILGICLGFQTIGIYFGATLYNLNQVMHGKKSLIKLKSDSMYEDIPSEIYDIKGIQYHPESVLTKYGELIIKNWLSS